MILISPGWMRTVIHCISKLPPLIPGNVVAKPLPSYLWRSFFHILKFLFSPIEPGFIWLQACNHGLLQTVHFATAHEQTHLFWEHSMRQSAALLLHLFCSKRISSNFPYFFFSERIVIYFLLRLKANKKAALTTTSSSVPIYRNWKKLIWMGLKARHIDKIEDHS